MLTDVIAAADYINHAIVTFEEMEGALARLTESGFLVDRGGRLSPSRKTMAFYRSVTTPRRPVLKGKEDLQKLLGASDRNPSVLPKDAKGSAAPPRRHSVCRRKDRGRLFAALADRLGVREENAAETAGA